MSETAEGVCFKEDVYKLPQQLGAKEIIKCDTAQRAKLKSFGIERFSLLTTRGHY